MKTHIEKARASGDMVKVYTPMQPYHFRIVNPEREEGRQTLALIESLI